MVVGEFSQDVDVVVVGAGPGGYTAAIRAAQMGKNVTVVEKGDLGGVCLNIGCIPSKALISAAERYEHMNESSDMGIEAENVKVDFAKVQEWKSSVVQKLTGGVEGLLKSNKIEVMKGEAIFVNENEMRVIDGYEASRLRFEHCIVATGSRPVELPTFPYGDRVISSNEALELEEIPESMVVIGGGYIGIELGQAYAKFGTKVTVLEGEKSILPGFDKRLGSMVSRKLKQLNVDVQTNAMAKGVEDKDGKATVTYEVKGEEKQVTADYVMVTVGRKPNTEEMGLEAAGVKVKEDGLIEVDHQCKTASDKIYAIGDIVDGPALAHKASYEGKVAAEVIGGEPSVIDYRCIPSVIFSDPEIATVGLTQKEAKNEGYEAVTGKFAYGANGRALALNVQEGSVTLIGDKESGLVLGAQIVGPEASNIIAEVGLAIEMGATFEDIALTIHAHPTLGEIIMESAENALGMGIHSA